MARSRFSGVEEVSQRVDVRVRRNENGDSANGPTPKKLIWWSSTHIFLAVLALIMVSAWMTRKNGGFSWKATETPMGSINYHGLFMVTGYVLLSGVADILYRMCRSSPKLSVKIAHGTIHFTGWCFVVAGLCGAFWFHDAINAPHTLSTHSWIGLLTVILMTCQWTVGFLGFLLPGFKQSVRTAYVPWHQFTGQCIFFLSLANILIGINKVGAGATVMNCLALVIILFGLNGGYILDKNCFARDAQTGRDDCCDRPDTSGYTKIERRTSVHSRHSGRGDVERPEAGNRAYINIAGTGGTYQSLGDDPAVKEALSTGRDTFSRFQERLEKKKHVDLPGEFVTTTTVTE